MESFHSQFIYLRMNCLNYDIWKQTLLNGVVLVPFLFMMVFELLHHISTLKCKQVMGQNYGIYVLQIVYIWICTFSGQDE